MLSSNNGLSSQWEGGYSYRTGDGHNHPTFLMNHSLFKDAWLETKNTWQQPQGWNWAGERYCTRDMSFLYDEKVFFPLNFLSSLFWKVKGLKINKKQYLHLLKQIYCTQKSVTIATVLVAVPSKSSFHVFYHPPALCSVLLTSPIFYQILSLSFAHTVCFIPSLAPRVAHCLPKWKQKTGRHWAIFLSLLCLLFLFLVIPPSCVS